MQYKLLPLPKKERGGDGRSRTDDETENRQKTPKQKSFVNLYSKPFFDNLSYPQVLRKYPIFLWILWIKPQKWRENKGKGCGNTNISDKKQINIMTTMVNITFIRFFMRDLQNSVSFDIIKATKQKAVQLRDLFGFAKYSAKKQKTVDLRMRSLCLAIRSKTARTDKAEIVV